MPDIFISYASEDRSRAETLAKALEEQGWSVWWDKTIPPGKTFDQVIEEAITAARCVVVLWSRKSIKSDWVKEEANIGKERKILVPAKIDPVALPLGFGRIQAADLTNWKGEKEHPGFFSLQNAISELAGPAPQRDKSLPDTELRESNFVQQVKIKSEESETFQPDTSHLNSDAKESPITRPKASRKILLAFVIGTVALILVIYFVFGVSKDYKIAVSYNNGGTIKSNEKLIEPGKEVLIAKKNSRKFEIKKDDGNQIVDVLVDGESVGPVSSHLFESVTRNHTISASFAPITYTIEASSDSRGSISPIGRVKLDHGERKTFTITPDPCYQIADIKVDGESVGPVTSHQFKDVTSDHTIEASFSIKTLANPINLALQEAQASQSSDRAPDDAGKAQKAIDGNTDGNFWNGHVTHTKNEPKAWWQLKLNSSAWIKEIKIWNRTDECCRGRLSNFRISVSDDSNEVVWRKDFSESIDKKQSFEVYPPCRGLYVKIQKLEENPGKDGALSLAEVEVFGEFIE